MKLDLTFDPIAEYATVTAIELIDETDWWEYSRACSDHDRLHLLCRIDIESAATHHQGPTQRGEFAAAWSIGFLQVDLHSAAVVVDSPIKG